MTVAGLGWHVSAALTVYSYRRLIKVAHITAVLRFIIYYRFIHQCDLAIFVGFYNNCVYHLCKTPRLE